LITQVVGRSGRGEYLGKAYIQTSFPDSEVITLAKEQDFNSFYNIELPIRQALTYPPFCDICAVGFSGEKEADVYKTANAFLNNLKQIHSDEYKDINIIVLGPVVPRVAKIAGKYRSRILIKCRNNKRFREMMNCLLKSFSKDKTDVSIYLDINPENLM
jgi:primosomal protein N' (replication factor Y)